MHIPRESLTSAIDADDHLSLAGWAQEEPAFAHSFIIHLSSDGEEMWLPLHLAAHRGATRSARALIEAGAKPDSRTRSQPATATRGRQTALHLAAAHGHDAMVALLLKHGASVEVLDARQRRPLHGAASALAPRVIELLISAGATVDPTDAQQRTPLHAVIAVLRDRPSDAEIRDQRADAATRCLASLIESGADVDHPCPREADSFTPLHRCVNVGDHTAPLLDALLDAGADRGLRDPRHERTAGELADALGRQTLLARLEV